MKNGKDRAGFSVGHTPPNKDAKEKACGTLLYIDDIKLPNLLYSALLLSPHAHAKILSIDTEEAEKIEGVKGIIHCFNTEIPLYNSAMRFFSDNSPEDMPKTERVFDSVVRFVGDRVAAVAAETEEIARRAVKSIKVEYKELPAIITLEQALEEDTGLQANPFGLNGSNLCGGWVSYGSDTEEKVKNNLQDTAITTVTRFHTSRVHHGYMEPVCHIANYSHSGLLTIWTSSQNVFCFRDVLSGILNLPQNLVRIIKTPSGGAFGGKLEVMHEPVVALLSMLTRRPVKLRLNRREVFSSTRCRHEALLEITTGTDAEGNLKAQHILSRLNTGAYAGSGPNTVGAQSGKTFVLYKADHMYYKGASFYTNTPIAGAMRGYGCPQLMVSREVHMDILSRKLSMDPVDFRLRNILMPHSKNCLGKNMHNARVVDCLKVGAELFNWRERKKNRKTFPGKAIGFGVGIAVHGSGWFPVYQDMTSVTMMMNNDGSLQILTGIHDLGTGAKTVLAQIAAEVLKIPLDFIEIVEADTAVTPLDLGAQASRSTYIGGNCVKECSEKLKAQLLEEAKAFFSCREEDLELGKMCFFYGSKKKLVTYSELADSAQRGLFGPQRQICAIHSYCSGNSVYSYSAVFAETEVDLESGKATVKDLLSVHDSGKIINPALCEGQVHGGIHMGLGYALSEDMDIDENTGIVRNDSFKKYHIFKAEEMPEIRVHFIESSEDSGPFGAKSIGECATDGVAGAVVNSVSDALGGIELDRIPLYPQYLLSKIKYGNP